MVTKSNNLDLVKADIIRKQIAKAYKKNKSPGYARSKRSNAFLREVLQDENDITDTLIKSDKMMAVVKDIFGDNPGKFRGLPNVTTAPEGTVPSDRKLPNGSSYSHPSKLDVLSETVMDQTALNDLESSDASGSDDDPGSEAINYKTSMDMEHFRRLLQKAEVEEEKQKGRHQLSHSMAERALQKTLDQITRDTGESWLARDGAVTPDSPMPNSQPDGAMNDTGKIKKTRSCTDQGKNLSESVTAPAASVHDLQQVLENLEKTMAEYELQTGRQPTGSFLRGQQQNTFSSYTTSLVTSVTKLINYFKESEIKLKEECVVSEQLWQDLQNLRALVDSLTAEITYQRGEFAKLQSEFFYFKNENETQIHTLRQALTSHGIEVPPVISPPRPEFQLPYSGVATLPSTIRQDTYQSSSTTSGLPKPQIQPEGQVQHSAGQDPGQTSNINTAMLLSPPKQTDSPRPNGMKAKSLTNSELTQQQQEGLYHETQGMLNFTARSLTSGDRAALQQNMRQIIEQQVQHCNIRQQQLQEQQELNEEQSSSQFHGQVKQFHGQEAPLQQQLRQGLTAQHPISQQPYLNVQHLMPLSQEHIANGHEPKSIEFLSCHPTSLASSSSANNKTSVVPEVDDEMIELQKQLEELNRKHELAQSKLQYIYKCHDVPSENQPMQVTQQSSVVPNQGIRPTTQIPVSPPISPIPAASEHSEQSAQPNAYSKQPSRRMITVSLPRTDGAVVSSVGEPPAVNSCRMTSSTGQPAISGNRNVSVAGAKSAWFALSSHVSTS